MTSAAILGPNGPIARRLPGFVPRSSQQEMAAKIEATLANNGVFIGESGTGTGKTFAYLVPTLRSRKRVLISSGSKNLQDQIFRRDLPFIRDVLGIPVTATLLKGRANYLCRYRLERCEPSPHTHQTLHVEFLARIREWAHQTRRGDIAEIGDVPEDSAIWPLVTSTADNCLGTRCLHYDQCHVNRARREALDADVVVINHHLFFADLVLREEGFGQLLPGVDAVIFDEAHQLPDIAAGFFGLNLGSHQLSGLCRDTIAEDLREESNVPDLQDRARHAEKATAEFRLAFGVEPRRGSWHALDDDHRLYAALVELKDKLSALTVALEMAAGKGQALANCYRRAMDLLDRLYTITEPTPPERVPWFETTSRGFVLHLTALDATPLREQVASGEKAWIFTSATLTIDKSFGHYQAQMGLECADTGYWESPFDYQKHALLYIPANLPNPDAPEYTHRVIDSALPVLAASGGRAFILFTSHRALTIAAELLTGKLDCPLLIQGSAPRAALLERFHAAGNAVLLGTGSFWEGVDVRGDALSCVIIDKLPFASPDDPVLRARCEALEEAGQNPFLEYQLPNAVIALKQGAGRLIRDEYDRGVLVLCDPRLFNRAYGRMFLASLPPMPLTRELSDVERFLNEARVGMDTHETDG